MGRAWVWVSILWGSTTWSGMVNWEGGFRWHPLSLGVVFLLVCPVSLGVVSLDVEP